jgi:hypothetical protein
MKMHGEIVRNMSRINFVNNQIDGQLFFMYVMFLYYALHS